ncbi:heterochromatin protein 1-binding protein 3 isoform X2 [Lampris incognitus]|uniref:heterochromatin protein 1-binding protein 3 isoform X2 n=1 Tax=Lampris incognitus TaxID=2546036 RepID=UPI0024B603B7|nr:heterochromatin protein 1-binding protein 3 isoform X2 [Lampris incognitus]
MPIRRATGTPPKEKAPSTAPEKEPDATSEESPSAEEEEAPSSAPVVSTGDEGAAGEAEPKQNGEKTDEATGEMKGADAEKKELKDGFKLEKAKVKKVKRTIPAWASISSNKKVPVSNFAGTQPKVEEVLIEAIKSCNDRSGMSYKSVMKYIVEKYPGLELDKRKFLIKKAMKKQVEKGTIKQLKGKGLSGSFTIGKQPPAKTSTKKAVVFPGMKTESLGDALPLIITRLCEPKEASYILIKKYLEQHFPHLKIDTRPELLKVALVKAVEKGHLERITGKGASGTFQLKRIGDKVLLKGGDLEDAITAAITAMNEPKTCSTTSLRKYLIGTNKDSKEYRLVANLRKTLTKCKMLGWMEQITGSGFNGTYQLSFPYYPSPAILYPDKVIAPQKKKENAPKQGKMPDSSEEEESEEEEQESDDDTPTPKRKSQKRPTSRAPRLFPNKRPKSQPRAMGKRSVPKKRSASPAKKSVSQAKKPAPSARKPAASKKASTPPVKATPVKRAAPAKKPKTPAVKKLAKSATKRPAPQKSSPEEPAAKKELKANLSTRRSQRGKV